MSNKNGNNKSRRKNRTVDRVERDYVQLHGVELYNKEYKKVLNKLAEQERQITQLMGQPSRVLSDRAARNLRSNGLSKAPSRKGKGKSKSRTGSSNAGLPMAPVFREFLKANSSAFTTYLAPPFATCNPQPSIANRASRVTAVDTFEVQPGTMLSYRIGITDTVSMDGVAYHIGAYLDSFGVPRWSGSYEQGLAGGGTCYPSLGMQRGIYGINTGMGNDITGHHPLIPIQGWPLKAEVGKEGSQRYVPTCWSLELINETPIAERGGDFVTCLPSSTSCEIATTVEQLALFGSYKEHSSNSCVLHVPARPVDLAYRHFTPAASPLANKMTNPAGWAIYRNTTLTKQMIRIYGAAKYTMAGNQSAALLEPAEHAPSHAGHYENMSAAVTAGTVHPSNMPQLGNVVMAAISRGTSVLEAVAKAGLAKAESAASAGMSMAVRSAVKGAGFE